MRLTNIHWVSEHNVPKSNGGLVVGIMKWDGVVMPQPPVLRALEHTRKLLLRAGFEG
jgi:hypothetical protein